MQLSKKVAFNLIACCILRLSLDWAFGVFPFLFFIFLHAFVRLWLLFMYCSMNSSRKV